MLEWKCQNSTLEWLNGSLLQFREKLWRTLSGGFRFPLATRQSFFFSHCFLDQSEEAWVCVTMWSKRQWGTVNIVAFIKYVYCSSVIIEKKKNTLHRVPHKPSVLHWPIYCAGPVTWQCSHPSQLRPSGPAAPSCSSSWSPPSWRGWTLAGSERYSTAIPVVVCVGQSSVTM